MRSERRQVERSETWRCRWELHPRMEVLQTSALLLGYGTEGRDQYTDFTDVRIQEWMRYFFCVNVSDETMATTWRSREEETESGVKAVTVYPVPEPETALTW